MWPRAELSKRLLSWGALSCDMWDGRGRDGICMHCGHDYSRHLAKHAAEEIGVLEARLQRLRPRRED